MATGVLAEKISVEDWAECHSFARRQRMANKNGCYFIVVLSSLVFLSLTPWGLGQNSQRVHAVIPFDFWVEGTSLPAGDYIIEHLESTSYLLFHSTDSKNSVAVYVLPLDEDPAAEGESKLVFKVNNGKHYLYGGWGPFGRRVVAAESAFPAPTGTARAEVPITSVKDRPRP